METGTIQYETSSKYNTQTVYTRGMSNGHKSRGRIGHFPFDENSVGKEGADSIHTQGKHCDFFLKLLHPDVEHFDAACGQINNCAGLSCASGNDKLSRTDMFSAQSLIKSCFAGFSPFRSDTGMPGLINCRFAEGEARTWLYHREKREKREAWLDLLRPTIDGP